ncbi:hypothetical protein QAD02_006471 [Eretmocerus hayati]|uniref:Uncharacterized protein n=1 Tax=Eretmocerus hayati TaxID=131215 RepID=A0ACC2N104_9HYME|nr:hypothetical protein QAD02_006471 [Eretmocerus hayati]
MSEENKEKLRQVLQLFLQPDFNVVTPTYLDLLLTHINDEIAKGNQDVTDIVRDWLITATNLWNEDTKPSPNVSTFTIKLLGLMSKDESSFIALNQNCTHSKICSLFQFQNNDTSASIRMAFTTMLLNILEHHTGREWIAESKAWKEVLRFAQINHTMYVTRECHKFLSRLLIKECNNRKLCEEIILSVTEPLIELTGSAHIDNHYVTLGKYVSFEQNNLLLVTLELLLEIMDYAIFHDLYNPIPDMFEELTNLESRVKVVFEVSISTPFMTVAFKLYKLLLYTKLRSCLQTSDQIDKKTFEQFCLGLCYTSTLLLSKKYILDLVISKKIGIIYWKKLSKLKNLESPEPFKFETQAIALMTLPLSVSLTPKYKKDHFLFEQFLEKIFEVTCTSVQRLAYSIRDVIMKNDFPMESICKSTVDHLIDIVDVIDRETAVIAFQMISHQLKNFVTASSETTEISNGSNSTHTSNNNHSKTKPFKSYFDGDPINDQRMLLASLLNGLNVFTEKFKLKWQECVETICMLSIAEDILNHPGVDPQICTLALKTCKLAIQNFMPPSLALLVEFDEHTRDIGVTLFKRMHDPNWEVQDSVLEVLNTIVCLSENKYPPYQSFLLESEFLDISIELVKGESESYVRASALKFISTAVRINKLWEKKLSQMNLLDIAIKLVYGESEAIVRREAVALIKELYIYRMWPKSSMSTMSQAMTVAAVLDLHWEVKINALEFWRHFIISHLTDQGMLDGHFPNVTFSKEHRKIVSLDENEIKQRLNKALDELSRQRCLGVLLVTLKDESDLEVSRVSANIIRELRRVLLDYKVNEPMPEPRSPGDSAIMDCSYVRRNPNPTTSDEAMEDPPSNSSNEVIERIVDESDANLLASIYRESMKMHGDDAERSRREVLDYVATVTRSDFLVQMLNFDLDAYVQQRSDWLKNYTCSFDSVLEDIILVSQKSDVNCMDCY